MRGIIFSSNQRSIEVTGGQTRSNFNNIGIASRLSLNDGEGLVAIVYDKYFATYRVGCFFFGRSQRSIKVITGQISMSLEFLDVCTQRKD